MTTLNLDDWEELPEHDSPPLPPGLPLGAEDVEERTTYTLKVTDLKGQYNVFEGYGANSLAEARDASVRMLAVDENLRNLTKGLAAGWGVLAEFRRDGTERWRKLGIYKAASGEGRTFRTIAEIASANTSAGWHWFSPDSLQFFNCRLRDDWVLPIPGGALFVSSEKLEGEDRRYSVRRAWVDGQVDTVGDFLGHASVSEAKAALRDEAARLVEEGG